MTDELFELKCAISNIEYILSGYDKADLEELIRHYLPKEEQDKIRADIKARLEEKLIELKKEFDEL